MPDQQQQQFKQFNGMCAEQVRVCVLMSVVVFVPCFIDDDDLIALLIADLTICIYKIIIEKWQSDNIKNNSGSSV